MKLGELTAQRNHAPREHLGDRLEGRLSPMRGLVEQQRAGDGRETTQTLYPFSVFARQKALEEKLVARNTGKHERRHTRGRARQDLDARARLASRVDQHLAGIGNARHAGIRGKGDSLTGEQPIHELGSAPRDHVLVTADKRL